ncbi:MAG: TetR family transcriptional regulator [Bryobacterales bacterium]|jgi:AcrR family transcriptional regulator|nr:TetR family transcriptional regulator [Bryobacterales bacterium]
MAVAEVNPGKAKRVRNPDATRLRVLQAATTEFARHGFAGARIDAIALRAKANKQMIYHYFHSKQDLYLAVLEEAYGDIRRSEAQLQVEHLEPVEALSTMVRFTWDYYLRHPEFLALVTNENLHRARHLKRSTRMGELHGLFRVRLADILSRGQRKRVFRRGVDADQLNLTIAAIGYYYLNNRFTNSVIYQKDLGAPEALEERLRFNLDTVLRMVLRESPAQQNRGKRSRGADA